MKFCSDRCKRHKLRPADRRIEAAFAALLDGQDASQFAAVPGEVTNNVSTESNAEAQSDKPKDTGKANNKKKQQQPKVKGDPRIIVSCSEVETLIYGSREDPEKTFGRKKNRARRGVADDEVWKSIDMEGSDTDPGTASTASAGEESVENVSAGSADEGGVTVATDKDMVKLKSGRVRPPQSESEVNGSIGGEKGWAERIEETPEMLQKRREGQRKAEEKEMVKSAARRAVVFGLERSGVLAGEPKKGKKGEDDEGKQEGRRMCEAVMNGAVVEPSYAKGDWGIRWREM